MRLLFGCTFGKDSGATFGPYEIPAKRLAVSDDGTRRFEDIGTVTFWPRNENGTQRQLDRQGRLNIKFQRSQAVAGANWFALIRADPHADDGGGFLTEGPRPDGGQHFVAIFGGASRALAVAAGFFSVVLSRRKPLVGRARRATGRVPAVPGAAGDRRRLPRGAGGRPQLPVVRRDRVRRVRRNRV